MLVPCVASTPKDTGVRSGVGPDFANLPQRPPTFDGMSQPITLQGEPVETLRQFLGYIKTSQGRNGMVRLSADAPGDIAAPFIRAVMRRQAQLLRADADQIDVGHGESRTHEQRRADAFVDLGAGIDAALNYFPPSQGSER